MKAQQWKRLGRALQRNAELLEQLSFAHDGVARESLDDNPSLGWLIQKGVIESEEDVLFLGSALSDLHVQLSSPGFDRAALDFKEVLLSIERHAKQYLQSIGSDTPATGGAHLERLNVNVRQIERNLRGEFSMTRSVIEGIGYSSLPSVRQSEAQYAIGRLKRLNEKLAPFTRAQLSFVAQGNRELRRVFLNEDERSLLSVVSRRRQDFIGLIDRLETLNLSIRRHSEFRDLLLTLDRYRKEGNVFDVEPDEVLQEMAEAELLLGAPLVCGGLPALPESATDDARRTTERIMVGLPTPALASNQEQEAVQRKERNRAKRKVVPHAIEVQSAPVPFARPYLEAMLRELAQTGDPQSAAAHWLKHGDPDIEVRHWLLILMDYDAHTREQKVKQLGRIAFKDRPSQYELVPKYRSFKRHEGNRRVYDVIVRRTQSGVMPCD